MEISKHSAGLLRRAINNMKLSLSVKDTEALEEIRCALNIAEKTNKKLEIYIK